MINTDRDLDFNPAIDKIMDKLKELEDKVSLIESNTKATVETIDKFLKKKIKGDYYEG